MYYILYSYNKGSWREENVKENTFTVVIEKNTCINEPGLFKPVLFKG